MYRKLLFSIHICCNLYTQWPKSPPFQHKYRIWAQFKFSWALDRNESVAR